MQKYRSDLTDSQWKLIKSHIPHEKDGGRSRTTDVREVVNALLYMNKTGCQWNMLPHDFPPKSTVHDYFQQWRDDGTLDEIARVLREKIRIKKHRNAKPSASVIDSQTVKITAACEQVGYDGNKKIKGRKRHIAVDVLGLILCVVVGSAGISDRAGAKLLTTKLFSIFSTIKIIWADGGYSGNPLMQWIKKLANCVLEIVKRPRKKFQIVKWRWIVERTFGWLNHYRRLSKDYEYYNSSSEAWITLASINIMVHRIKSG